MATATPFSSSYRGFVAHLTSTPRGPGHGCSLLRLAVPDGRTGRATYEQEEAARQAEIAQLNRSIAADTEMGGVPCASVHVTGQLGRLRPPPIVPTLERQAASAAARAAQTAASVDAVMKAVDSMRISREEAAAAAAAAVVAAGAAAAAAAVLASIAAPAALPPANEWVDDATPLRLLDEVVLRGHFPTPRAVALREPLRFEDAVRVDEALAPGSNDDAMTVESIAGIRLRRFDTRTLRPGAWLNDEVCVRFELGFVCCVDQGLPTLAASN